MRRYFLSIPVSLCLAATALPQNPDPAARERERYAAESRAKAKEMERAERERAAKERAEKEREAKAAAERDRERAERERAERERAEKEKAERERVANAVAKPALQPPELSAWDYAQPGRRLMEKEYYQDAISEFSRAISAYPTYPLAYFWRGISYVKREQFDQAFPDFEEAKRLSPPHPMYTNAWHELLNCAIDYNNKGQFDKANQLFKLVMRMTPDETAYVLNARGVTYRNARAYDLAVKDLDEAIRLGNRGSVYELGRTYYVMGKYALAIKSLDQYIEMDSTSAWPFYYRALAKRKIGDAAGGDADMERARKLEPRVEEFGARILQ